MLTYALTCMPLTVAAIVNSALYFTLWPRRIRAAVDGRFWLPLPLVVQTTQAQAAQRTLLLSGVHSGSVIWCHAAAGSGGSQGFPSMAARMAPSAVMPWAAAESR